MSDSELEAPGLLSASPSGLAWVSADGADSDLEAPGIAEDESVQSSRYGLVVLKVLRSTG